MEYEYFRFTHDGVTLHLVRVDVHFITTASGHVFQRVLIGQQGPGTVVVMMRDPSGIHTAFFGGIPANFTDKNIDDLAWQEMFWGEQDDPAEEE